MGVAPDEAFGKASVAGPGLSSLDRSEIIPTLSPVRETPLADCGRDSLGSIGDL